jgi:hypothetical protein
MTKGKIHSTYGWDYLYFKRLGDSFFFNFGIKGICLRGNSTTSISCKLISNHITALMQINTYQLF